MFSKCFNTTFKLQQNYENHNYQTDHESSQSTQSWFENFKEKCVSYMYFIFCAKRNKENFL